MLRDMYKTLPTPHELFLFPRTDGTGRLVGSGSLRKAFCGGRWVHYRTQGMTSGNARLALATVFSLATRHKSGVHVCTPSRPSSSSRGAGASHINGPPRDKAREFLN